MSRTSTPPERHDQGSTVSETAPGAAAGASADRPTVGVEGVGMKRPVRDAVLAIFALTAVFAAMLSAYTVGLSKPSPHDIPVAVVGSAQITTRLATGSALDVRAVEDVAQAKKLVLDRSVYGVIDATGSGVLTLYVAGGASHQIDLALQGIGQQLATSSHSTVKVVDLAPTSANNPNGTVEFYCILFLAIGGALGATVLGRVLGAIRDVPHLARRVLALLAYAVLLGAVFVLLADGVFDALDGHPARMFLTFTAVTFSVALVTSGVTALLGTFAGMVLTLAFTILGNPSSGGAVDQHMLDRFFSDLSPVFPQGAGLSVLRGVLYFEGAGIGSGLVCLALWAVVGLLMLIAFAHQAGLAGAASSPVPPQAEGARHLSTAGTH